METKIALPILSRPLSPHLQIYRWQITMTLSILHRITGAALTVGTILLLGWLWSAAYSPQCFHCIHAFFITIWGKLLLTGWVFAFWFHFCNGIRHLFWDIGKGFEIHTAASTGWAVVFFALFFTAGCSWVIFVSSAADLGAHP